MRERHRIANGFLALTLGFYQAACQKIPETLPISTESCPPTSTSEEEVFGNWLRMEVGGEPFVFPLSLEDPTNEINQARISIVEIRPNEGVVVRIEMPESEPAVAFVGNDLDGALRLSSRIDWGLQFWACGGDDYGFMRLAELATQVPLPEA